MWGFVDCTHYYHRLGRTTVVIKDASLTAGDQEKVAVFAPPGHGKSSMIRLLTGVERPRGGTVMRPQGAWPLGYSGGFRNEMTGDANARALALIAGVDPDELSAFAYLFSELGEAYFMPLAYYTNRMKARLGFATTFGIPARLFLADDKLSGGDPDFREKCDDKLRQCLADSGLLFLTSNPRPAEEFCERFVVLEGGGFHECESFDAAKDRFEQVMLEQDSAEDVFTPEEDNAQRNRDELLFFDLA